MYDKSRSFSTVEFLQTLALEEFKGVENVLFNSSIFLLKDKTLNPKTFFLFFSIKNMEKKLFIFPENQEEVDFLEEVGLPFSIFNGEEIQLIVSDIEQPYLYDRHKIWANFFLYYNNSFFLQKLG